MSVPAEIMSPSPMPELIYGVWYLDPDFNPRLANQHWTFIRERDHPYGWGQRYEFWEDGVFIDAYTARCGNDPHIHQWQGHWFWEPNQGLLLLQVNRTQPEPERRWPRQRGDAEPDACDPKREASQDGQRAKMVAYQVSGLPDRLILHLCCDPHQS